jgi:hypothetical protein
MIFPSFSNHPTSILMWKKHGPGRQGVRAETAMDCTILLEQYLDGGEAGHVCFNCFGSSLESLEVGFR